MLAGDDALPGGEPPTQAPRELARLLREQLGCEANVGELFAQVPLRISGVRGWLFVYRAKLAVGFQPEGLSLRWLDDVERDQASFGRAERVTLAAWEAPLTPEEAAQEKD